MRPAMGGGARPCLLTGVALASVLSAVMAGCWMDDTPPAAAAGDAAVLVPETPDAGADAADGGDDAALVCAEAIGATEGASCGDVVPGGPCVQEIRIDDSAPAPAGGTLVEGTYDLTDLALYTNPAGPTGPLGEPRRETIALAADGATWVMNAIALSAGLAARRTLSVVGVGPQLHATVTCPAADAGPGDAGAGPAIVYTYTASGEALTLYRLTAGGAVEAGTYVRR